MRATITLEYDDEKTARAVAKAISPDNFKVPLGLKVKTQEQGCSVVSDVELKGKLATFIATIDDLLACASTAEKTLGVVKNK